MITLEEAVLTYVAAWNENDETKQRELIEKCWADHGTVTSNYEHIAGREALLESIGAWRRVCPNDRAVFTSGIEHHHWFRFTAMVIRPDGTTYSEVLDIGEVGTGRADCQNHQLPRSPTTHTGDVTNGSPPPIFNSVSRRYS